MNQETDSVGLNDSTKVLPVDIEHGGIRVAGCFTFVISGFAFYWLGQIVLPDAGLLMIIISVLLASGATYLADMLLKGRWLSGRELVMAPDEMRIQQGERTERLVKRDEPFNALRWCFEVRRTGRVKKGWYVVACTLEQEGVYLPIYTFCSPEVLETLEDKDEFVLLERPRKGENQRDMKLAGQQRRLQDAETVRGIEGAELTYDDFVVYMAYLKREQWLS